MAKSITSACARAVVCPTKRSLFFSCVLVRKNSGFVSVKTSPRVDAITAVRNQSTCQSSFTLESRLGPVDVPDVSLPNYIWKDFEEWSDKPAVVSKQRQLSCDWSVAASVAMVTTLSSQPADQQYYMLGATNHSTVLLIL